MESLFAGRGSESLKKQVRVVVAQHDESLALSVGKEVAKSELPEASTRKSLKDLATAGVVSQSPFMMKHGLHQNLIAEEAVARECRLELEDARSQHKLFMVAECASKRTIEQLESEETCAEIQLALLRSEVLEAQESRIQVSRSLHAQLADNASASEQVIEQLRSEVAHAKSELLTV